MDTIIPLYFRSHTDIHDYPILIYRFPTYIPRIEGLEVDGPNPKDQILLHFNIPTISSKEVVMSFVDGASGGFLEAEIDGKPYLVYHDSLALPPQHVYLCPCARVLSILNDGISGVVSTFTSSTFFNPTYLRRGDTTPIYERYNHHPLPLFWCNNEIPDKCSACKVGEVGADYYFCARCDEMYHKGCVESPLEIINHPSHPEHSFKLHFLRSSVTLLLPCMFCGEHVDRLFYSCDLCDIVIHVVCAQKKIPFFIDQPKRHHHILTLFLRQSSLTCNVCGLINPTHLTYVCPPCNFVAHRDCIYVPRVIKISRHHHHRISFTSSLQPGEEWICGVCRKGVENKYGAYICNSCSIGYAVHTKCALRTDIWDGKELEGVPEEEDYDIHKDAEPYQKTGEGTILHFSHHHQLVLEISDIFDETKFCQACVLPIYNDFSYSCQECDYILHETCAEARLKMVHPLHPHPLQLDPVYVDDYFDCSACLYDSNGFTYRCSNQEDCCFKLDIRCALTSEPFSYQGHKDPLFLSLDPKEKPSCHVCKSKYCTKALNCIECEFVICFKCATLPYMVRYKHDKHYLTFCLGEEASDSDWCEVCEGKIAIGGEVGFYTCNDCCTTLHIDCLFGIFPYLKVGQSINALRDIEFLVLHNNSSTRPICKECHLRCPYPKVFEYDNIKFCTFDCANSYV